MFLALVIYNFISIISQHALFWGEKEVNKIYRDSGLRTRICRELMAVAGLSFEELEFSSPSLLLLLFLAAFGFLSPVLVDFSLLVLFLPAIALRLCRINMY